MFSIFNALYPYGDLSDYDEDYDSYDDYYYDDLSPEPEYEPDSRRKDPTDVVFAGILLRTGSDLPSAVRKQLREHFFKQDWINGFDVPMEMGGEAKLGGVELRSKDGRWYRLKRTHKEVDAAVYSVWMGRAGLPDANLYSTNVLIARFQHRTAYYSAPPKWPTELFAGLHFYLPPGLDSSAGGLERLEAQRASLRVVIETYGGVVDVEANDRTTHILSFGTRDFSMTNSTLRTYPNIIVVAAHWLTACLSAGRLVPASPFLFSRHEGPLIYAGSSGSIYSTGTHSSQDLSIHLLARRAPSANWTSAAVRPRRTPQPLQGKIVRLAVDAGVNRYLSCVLHMLVERAGGKLDVSSFHDHMIHSSSDKVERRNMEKADILIKRWRTGDHYNLAIRKGKIIATLPWLLHVLTACSDSSELPDPKDRALFYPAPRSTYPKQQPLKNVKVHLRDLGGETAPEFRYARELLSVLGGTLVSFAGGAHVKITSGPVTTAEQNSLPRPVSLAWLEACYARWSRVDETEPAWAPGPSTSDKASKGKGKRKARPGEDDEPPAAAAVGRATQEMRRSIGRSEGVRGRWENAKEMTPGGGYRYHPYY